MSGNNSTARKQELMNLPTEGHTTIVPPPPAISPKRLTPPSSALSAEIVAFVMKAKPMNQTDLANLLKVSQSYISKVKNGQKNFTIAHLEKLCEELGMPLAVLVYKATKAPALDDHAEQKVDRGLAELMQMVYPEHIKPDDKQTD